MINLQNSWLFHSRSTNFSVFPHTIAEFTIFLRRWTKFAFFSCLIDKICSFFCAQSAKFHLQNSGFFLTSSAKLKNFLHLMNVICDFFVPDPWNLQFLSNWRNLQYFFLLVSKNCNFFYFVNWQSSQVTDCAFLP